MKIKLYVAIGIGGMIGAVGRYGISVAFENNNSLPYATLAANLIGCFLLSFLMNNVIIKQKLSQETFSALSIGMIGAFTTFSTFAMETVVLWNSNIIIAIAYVIISVIGGLGFCYCGYKLATRKQVETI